MPRVSRVYVSLAPLRVRGVFRIAGWEARTSETLVARVELSDGTVGWGEAAPAPRVTGEHPGSALEAARLASQRIIGLDAEELGMVVDAVDRVLRGSPAARAALVNALYDAYGRIHGVPLCNLLGGCRSHRLETLVTVSLASPEEMASRALELVSSGYRRLKLKLGGPVDLDLERVRAVREAVGDGVMLTVDANQAWGYWEALRFAREAPRLGVALVEQPLPADDFDGLARLSASSPVPVAVDESVLGVRDAVRLYSLGFRGVVNIKVSRVGGVDRAAALARLSESLGLGVMIGCMLESGLATLSSAHLAATTEPLIVDLDSPLLIEDPSGCRVYEAPGVIRVPVGEPGVGCEPRLAV